jgi:hypothetical protein
LLHACCLLLLVVVVVVVLLLVVVVVVVVVLLLLLLLLLPRQDVFIPTSPFYLLRFVCCFSQAKPNTFRNHGTKAGSQTVVVPRPGWAT